MKGQPRRSRRYEGHEDSACFDPFLRRSFPRRDLRAFVVVFCRDAWLSCPALTFFGYTAPSVLDSCCSTTFTGVTGEAEASRYHKRGRPEPQLTKNLPGLLRSGPAGPA